MRFRQDEHPFVFDDLPAAQFVEEGADKWAPPPALSRSVTVVPHKAQVTMRDSTRRSAWADETISRNPKIPLAEAGQNGGRALDPAFITALISERYRDHLVDQLHLPRPRSPWE